LESFLFIVSHDLRNPILALGGMVSLLVEECSDELSASGKHYLSRIQANLNHMELLIKDVLELSKIGRTETQLDQIDVQETLDEILMDSPVKASQQHVQVCNKNQVQALRYNRHGLRHIFSNLIENALKFCAYQESARVEIGSEEDDKEYRFYVKDNGVGIDPRYHHSIFDLFYRIQDLKAVEGTARFVTDLLRRAFKSSLRSKAGFALSKPALNLLKHHLDPNNHNGAVFLGLNGLVVKSHGGANPKGVANAIAVAASMVRNDIIRKIGDDLDNFRAHAFNEAAQ